MTPSDALPGRIAVVARRDASPEPERPGFDPAGEYYECYLPVLGPASWLAYRYLAAKVTQEPALVDPAELAREIGLNPSLARSAPLGAAFARLEAFGLLRWESPAVCAVQRSVPALSNRLAKRLPIEARARHFRIVGGLQP